MQYKLARKLQKYLESETPKESWTTDSEIKDNKRKRILKTPFTGVEEQKRKKAKTTGT